MGLSLQQAYDLMHTDLEQFLHKVPLTIVGAGKKVAAVPYYLGDTGQTAFGRVKGMAVKETKRRLTSANYGSSLGPFNCIHVPVTQHHQLTPDSFIKVNHYNTSNFICTTQLSGCTFAVRKKKDGLEFTHIQPTGGTTPTQVHQQMAQQYDVTVGRGVSNGNGNYDSNTYVSIMGHKKNGLWTVYAQYQDTDKNVLGVECIYKEPSSVAYVT